MTVTFTDDDVEKRVENANGETLGVVTSIDDDRARVEPRAGVVDSIRAAIGWRSDGDATVTIRADAVDDIEEEAIRLEADSLEPDEMSAAEGTTDVDARTDAGTDGPEREQTLDEDTRSPIESADDRTADDIESRSRPSSVSSPNDRTGPVGSDGPDPNEDDAGGSDTTDTPGRDTSDSTTRSATPSSDDAPESDDRSGTASDVEAIDDPLRPETGSPSTDRSSSDRDDPGTMDDPIRPATGSPSETDRSSDPEPPETFDTGTGDADHEIDPDPDADVDRTDAEATDLTDELDRGTDLEETVKDRGTNTSDSPTAPAEELDQGVDLESVTGDERGRTDEDPVRDPGSELNERFDLEGATNGDDRNATERNDADAADELETGLGVEAAADPNRDSASERTRETETDPEQHPTSQIDPDALEGPSARPGGGPDGSSVGPGAASENADRDEFSGGESTVVPVGDVGDPDSGAGGFDASDDSTDDSDGLNRRVGEEGASPVEAMRRAQRMALSGPTLLFASGVAMQRAIGGATLSAIEGSIELQRLGIETVRGTTTATRRAVPGTSETMEFDRDPTGKESTGLASATANLHVAHERLLDTVERELEAGIDAIDDLGEARIEALAAGTDLLLAIDRHLEELPSAAGERNLDTHLDRTLSVYERLGQELELRRHEPAASLPAQRNRLERRLE